MKKVVVLLATAVACMAVVAGTASGAGGGGTVVASGFACGVLDGNGNVFFTTNSTLTVYSTKAVLQCVGNGAPAPSLTYWNYANTGISCGMLDFGSTNNWSNKVGYNGNSQLTCTQSLNGPLSAASGGAGLG